MATPWWTIDTGTATSPATWVLTQTASTPVPANSAFKVYGPFATEAQAKIIIPKGSKILVQAWDSASGTFGAIGTALGRAVNTQVPTVGLSNPLAGIEAIGSFFNKLGDANTWIRVGEFILGALLIISGALQLSGRGGDLKDIVKLTPAGKLL